MTSRILETILGNLPIVISLWTAFTLSWGLYVMVTFQHLTRFMQQHNIDVPPQDKWNINFMLATNIGLAGYLFIEPILSSSASDAIIVLNTFYNVYLVPTSIAVARTWRLCTSVSSNKSSPIDEDHLLT